MSQTILPCNQQSGDRNTQDRQWETTSKHKSALHVWEHICRHEPHFNEHFSGLGRLRDEETLDLISPFRLRCIQYLPLSVHPHNRGSVTRGGNVLDPWMSPFFYSVLLSRAKLELELELTPRQGPPLSVPPMAVTVCPLFTVRGAALSIVSALPPVNPPTDCTVQSACRAAVRSSATVTPSRTVGIFIFFFSIRLSSKSKHRFRMRVIVRMLACSR